MRKNHVYIIAGNRGTGKSDFLKNQLYQIDKKVLIVDLFRSPVWRNWKTWDHPERKYEQIPLMSLKHLPYWLSGKHFLYGSDPDILLENIHRHCTNCTVVLEDSTKHVGRNISKAVRSFVLDSKQKNVDIIFVFHSLQQIPRELMLISDRLTLFNTADTRKTAENRFNVPKMVDLYDHVQIESNKNNYFNATLRIT